MADPDDNTVSITLRYAEQFPQIQLLRNPQRVVPYALNLAIVNAKADVIVRLDAHTKYSADYFERIIETFADTDADIVGGPTRTAFESNFQEAVGIAISNPFGIGNSKVHDCNYRGYTDSVTFGAWKKKIFSKIGLFDTDLMRNQDDEFHYRAKSAGFRIFQNPDIELFYYPRNSLKGLIRQYYQYGLYKPLVLRKVKSEIKIRHLVPAIFVLYAITVFPVAAFFSWYIIPLFGYLALDLYFSFSGVNQFLSNACSCIYILQST